MNSHSAWYDPRRWWADLIGVWQDTRLIVITAQIAAIYAAILIPFKAGIPLIPGFVELRPANAIPIVASLLFGPAAAWGAGIGNIIGDCFGTLGPASLFGFWENFFLGYLPYLMWGHLGWLSSGQPPVIQSWRQGLEYGLICVVASGACAGIIAWGVEVLGLLPFMVLAPAVFFNNIVMGLFLGPPLLRFLYPRVQRWRLGYEDIRSSHTSLQNVHEVHKTSYQEDALHSDPSETRATCPALACDKFSFSYAGHVAQALRNITFSIAPGEFVMVLGSSGSGKSTLCYACNGLIPHMIHGTLLGEIRVCGEATRAWPVWKRANQVGLVFQDFETQLIGTTVGAELRHPMEFRESPQTFDEVNRRIDHALNSVGLDINLDRDPMKMSGGQRQRLVMASILVQEPQLFICDEPCSDIDPASRTQLRPMLGELTRKGWSVLMTEQDHESLQLANRVILLSKGEMVWEGLPTVLLRDPKLMREQGIRPLDLTECFEEFGYEPLPIAVEEAWAAAEELHLTLNPPAEVLDDTLRLGERAVSFGGMINPIIQLEDVSFCYENDSIIQGVTCAIAHGEFFAILGANGSGKSTLARLLNGILLPTSGRICVDGLETRTSSMNELASRVGLVFQNPDQQIFAETVWEEVAFGAKNLGYSQEEIDVRVRESLMAVGLPVEQNGGLDPFSLRKGERQCVAVASVLATRPAVLIFDEPTTGLDAAETDRMMAMICELHKQGHTIVIITHSMKLVAENVQRCLILNEGRILADGSPREIFQDLTVVRRASLEIPKISQFSQKWGHTLLTINEVKASLKQKTT